MDNNAHSPQEHQAQGSHRLWCTMALLVSSILWGCSFIFTQALFDSEPSLSAPVLAMGRLVIASLVGFPLLIVTHRLQRIQHGDHLRFIGIAFLEPFLYFNFETLGVQYSGSVLSSIIIACIPLCVPFAMALCRRERLHLRAIVGVVLSLVGIVMMTLNADNHIVVNSKGLVFLSAAVLIAVIYTLLISDLLSRYSPITVTVYQNFIGLLYFIPLVLIYHRDSLLGLSYTPRMWLLIGFLGLFCSTIAYCCFNIGIRQVGATQATVFNNLIPVFSLLLAVAVGQDSFTPWTKVVGVVIVLTGLFIATTQRPPRHRPTTKEKDP